MKKFLQKIGLVESFHVVLAIDPAEFKRRLQEIVQEGGTDYLSATLGIFNNDKKKYRGTVADSSFRFKRKRQLFDISHHLAVASGTYTGDRSSTKIDGEVNGFYYILIPMYLFLIIFFAFVLFKIFNDNYSPQPALISTLCFQGIASVFLPYYFAKKGVSRFKHSLERELFYTANR